MTWRLLGIPGSRRTIASSDSYHEGVSAELPGPRGKGEHADPFSVARVRPRTSKGITDPVIAQSRPARRRQSL